MSRSAVTVIIEFKKIDFPSLSLCLSFSVSLSICLCLSLSLSISLCLSLSLSHRTLKSNLPSLSLSISNCM